MGDSVATVHAVGSKVWVRDKVESWIKAEVKALLGDSVKVSTEKGDEKTEKALDCPRQNLESRPEEDMTKMPYLNEPAVLWNLKARYLVDDIYTYTGSILIAINPFAALNHLYGKHMMEQYRGVALGDLSPHVYALSHEAFHCMQKEGKSQSILVSGESGAGKTETSKLIMRYLAFMGGYKQGDAPVEEGTRSVEDQVLESNPLLEAFGNAKTVRNNNSSRFGKFVELQFDARGRICGAAIRTYLLERSRLVTVNDPERNYHIFYQLCEGASQQEKDAYHLKDPKDFHYLNQSSCFQLNGVDNARDYARTKKAMTMVGIGDEDQDAIFRTVASVLHLGNVIFTDGEAADSSDLANETSAKHLAAAADLLGVSPDGLKHALTTRTRFTFDGAIESPINPKAATDSRDSLAKTLYSRMFDWLVATVNESIGQDPNAKSVIGVLDIYGFEQFKENDFEQFCINLANEKLQQHFNQHVFKMEQAEYEREKISWSYIEFVDNQDVLDMIEMKPMGIIDLIDESCRFQNSTHEDLASKLYQNYANGKNKRFSKPRRSQTAFTINHYAGDVTYETDNFLQKNRDFVIMEHQELLGNSKYDFVKKLFPAPPEPADDGKKGGRGGQKSAFKFDSVGSQFKKQLGSLMDTLHQMQPHYIRCIKPNQLNQPLNYENEHVLHQLRCGGVLEAIRISCAGYPSKRHFEDFVDHFWTLIPNLFHSGKTDKELSLEILKKAGIEDYQIGTTKVFLRSGGMAVLDKVRTELMTAAAVKIQSHVKGWVERRKYKRVLAAAVVLQKYARGYKARKLARNLRMMRAAVVLQKMFKRFRAQIKFKKTIRRVVQVQSVWRGLQARRLAKDLRAVNAAMRIQRCWRMHKFRKEFVRVKKAVITIQTAYRAQVARSQLKKLQAEAREARKLLEDKKILQDKLKESHSVLENVQNQRNDLKQLLKDEKNATLAALERVREAERATEEIATRQAAAVNRAIIEERNIKQQIELDLENTKIKAREKEAKLRQENSALEKKLEEVNSNITKLDLEKNELTESYEAKVEDLMRRLENAVAQRNEARESVLRLENEVKQKEEELAMVKMMPAAADATAPIHQIGLPHSRSKGRSTSMDVTSTVFKRIPEGQTGDENGGDSRFFAGPGVEYPETDRTQQEMYIKQQQQLKEQRKLDEEKLLQGLSEHMGFQKGKPLAAVVIFRSCLHWKSFQADKTAIFDRIIQAIGHQIEERQDDNNTMAYWLTNIVTLLFMLQKNIKPASTGTYAKSRAGNRSFLGSNRFTSFLSRVTTPSNASFSDASVHGGTSGGIQQVEAKYPALLFKQQLDAFVQKIFPMLRDNVKKEITNHLSSCILAPKKGVTRTGSGRVQPRHGAGNEFESLHPTNIKILKDKRVLGNTQQLGRHWEEVLRVLDGLLMTLKVNFVPHFLMQMLFKQIFAFINVQLFNQLLLRRECCSFSNGEYVKTGLAEVEHWIDDAKRKFVGDSWDALKYIRQAVTFLVIHQKTNKSLEEITTDLCPVLSVQQLYRISTMYWDDKYNTETVSTEVLSRMKQLMVDSQSAASHSFLLDDDSSIPFQLEHIVQNMEDKELYSAVAEIPDILRASRGFEFLRKPLTMTA